MYCSGGLIENSEEPNVCRRRTTIYIHLSQDEDTLRRITRPHMCNWSVMVRDGQWSCNDGIQGSYSHATWMPRPMSGVIGAHGCHGLPETLAEARLAGSSVHTACARGISMLKKRRKKPEYHVVR